MTEKRISQRKNKKTKQPIAENKLKTIQHLLFLETIFYEDEHGSFAILDFGKPAVSDKS